jgi:rhomboid protease GluP
VARRDDDGSEYDVPNWMIQLGRLFGLSEIQARWKAIRLLRSLKRAREELAPPSSRVQTRGCPSCKAAQPATARVCASCGAKMTTGFVSALRTLGLSLPPMISVSSLLALANCGIYAFMWTRFPKEAFGGWSGQHLFEAGANISTRTFHGEPWRLVTYMFLHIGVLHIAFNTAALAQIGPTIEEVFGRGRMVLFYLVTGVVAGVASAQFHVVLSAGASGALMGLVGVAAGWGHRLGTAVGRDIRNRMLQWGVYTMIFGFAVHADNLAHGGGFVAGAILGYLVKTEHVARPRTELVNTIAGIVGGLVSALTVMFIVARVSHAERTPARDDQPVLDRPTMNDQPEVGDDDETEGDERTALAGLDAPPRAGARPERLRELEACVRLQRGEKGAAAAVVAAFEAADGESGYDPQVATAMCIGLARMRATCASLGTRSSPFGAAELAKMCEDVP